MLDTGLNLSMMSESEAKSLGLNSQSSTTSVSDISGLKGPGAQIVFVKGLLIGGTEIRRVPFLVVKDDNDAFVGIPAGQRGILGIQPLLALQTLTFGADDTLSFARKDKTAFHSLPLLFDGALPLTQVAFQGQSLTVTFDMGATQTTLNPPFAKMFPKILADGKSESHLLNGISGSTHQNSVRYPALFVVMRKSVNIGECSIVARLQCARRPRWKPQACSRFGNLPCNSLAGVVAGQSDGRLG